MRVCFTFLQVDPFTQYHPVDCFFFMLLTNFNSSSILHIYSKINNWICLHLTYNHIFCSPIAFASPPNYNMFGLVLYSNDSTHDDCVYGSQNLTIFLVSGFFSFCESYNLYNIIIVSEYTGFEEEGREERCIGTTIFVCNRRLRYQQTRKSKWTKIEGMRIGFLIDIYIWKILSAIFRQSNTCPLN